MLVVWIIIRYISTKFPFFNSKEFSNIQADVLYSAVKKRQMLWPNGLIAYELDTAFSK